MSQVYDHLKLHNHFNQQHDCAKSLEYWFMRKRVQSIPGIQWRFFRSYEFSRKKILVKVREILSSKSCKMLCKTFNFIKHCTFLRLLQIGLYIARLPCRMLDFYQNIHAFKCFDITNKNIQYTKSLKLPFQKFGWSNPLLM